MREIQPVHVVMKLEISYLKLDHCLQLLHHGVGPDPNMYLIHSMALCLYRPIIIISSLERHSDKKVIHFHENCNKPPIIVGLYQRDEHEIYLPFYFNRNTEFKLDHLKGKINIIGYTAKCVPPGFESRSILDMEVFAILTTLYSFQKLISGVKVTLKRIRSVEGKLLLKK